MTDLSPAAQAVLDAATTAAWSSAFNAEGKGAAAALRTAALYCKRDRVQLLALASELDAQEH